ncbi:MAG: pyruvate kinase, partial [Sulfolobales archaeon]
MDRRTKIIATIGPSSLDKIKELSKYVDIFRINLAHGDDKQRIEYLKRIREEAPEVPILADLPGLKLRVGKLEGDKIMVKRGQKIILGKEIPVNPLLFKIVSKGSYILISDGAIKVKIIEVGNDYAEGIVESEGIISSGKGINIPNVKLPFSAREEDIRLAKLAKDYGVDFIGLSYVTSRDDIIKLREIVSEDVWIVAKIEMELKDLESVINEADSVMIARGDLGVQVGLERLPIIQAKI